MNASNDWRDMTLGEVAEVIGGGTPSTKQEEYWNGNIPWITPKDLSNFPARYISQGERSISQLGLSASSAKLLPQGAILLTTRAPVGYLAIAENEVSTNQGFKSLVSKPGIDNLFLFYLLKQNIGYLKSQSSGTTFGELSGSTLKSLVFSFPPHREQKAIAAILSSLDDKIDLLRRQNQTLEAIAQTLFRQWFIEDADASWAEVKFADVYEFIKGCEPGSKSYESHKSADNVRFIRVGDMLDNVGKTYIPMDKATVLCDASDLLVSFDGTVGRVTYGISGAYSSGMRKITSTDSVYNNFTFKYLLFKNPHIQAIIQEHATGTVIVHASSAIKYLSFKLPNKKVIQKFNAMTAPFFNKLWYSQSQIRTLETLRDTLLPKLISGKIKTKPSSRRPG